MASYPLLLGSWVIRSRATVWNGFVVGAVGILYRGVLRFLVRFFAC
jgi:hypothetical protein